MTASSEDGFFTIASAIFLVINAIGQVPLFIAMLSRFDQKRQQKIIIRELLVALAILLLFTFFGDDILKVIGISRSIIAIAGGVLLFLISLTMIFPKSVSDDEKEKALTHEPMIIPLAIPIITGPGAITTVMLYAHEVGSSMLVAGAVVAAWIPSLIILLMGSFIKKILGEKGLIAVERLGGMLVCLIGVQMLSNGILTIVKEYFHIAL